MLKNYLKIAWRNILRNKLHTFINVTGLTIAFACCLLIVLYVKEELAYDKFHRDSDRIYRVVKDFVNDDGSALPDATTPPALIPAIMNEIPEAEQGVRLFPSWGSKSLVKNGDNIFYEEGIYSADSNVFQLFTFDFVAGDPEKPLHEQSSVVITTSIAEKYFGETWRNDPQSIIGKQIEMGEGDNRLRTITAVIRDVPRQSHFHFDFLLPMWSGIDENWGWYNWYSYIRIREDAQIKDVEQKIIDLFKKNNPENNTRYYVQALEDIHLKSRLKWELEPNGDIKFVKIFSIIGVFILLIASINYINLSILQSFNRAKEVGIRKVSGAFRSGLIRQFLMESAALCLLAFFFAIGLVDLILQPVNTIFGKSLSLFAPENYVIIGAFLVLIILTGVLSGIYPAFFISRIKPASILKGTSVSGSHRNIFRKGLIMLQFVISIALIAGTVIVNQQVSFLHRKDLGFEKEQRIVLPNIQRIPNKQAVKHELLQAPGVERIGASNGVLGGLNWTTYVTAKGLQQGVLMNFSMIDADYIDVMEFKIKEGRGFDEQFMADTLDAIVLNETAIRDLGITGEPIGSLVTSDADAENPEYWRIVGVVKDFNFANLRLDIKPYMFRLTKNGVNNFVVKINTSDVPSTLRQLSEVWEKNASGRPFEYFFLDDNFATIYKDEESFKTVFSALTFLAIYIACAGLFAIASYSIQKRIREIGIRKVLGATINQVTWMLTKEFVVIVLLANVIALPAAYVYMSDWLNDFAYRITPSVVSFVLAGAIALGIACIIVIWRSVLAANSNPARILRSE